MEEEHNIPEYLDQGVWRKTKTKEDSAYYANPYFQLSFNVADFFASVDFLLEDETYESAYLRTHSETETTLRNLDSDEAKKLITKRYDQWDNGIIKPKGGGVERYPPSGPHWFFPNIFLALRKGLFRDKDIEVFITRAKLAAGEHLGNLYKMSSDSMNPSFNPHIVLELPAAMQMALCYVTALEGVITARKTIDDTYLPPLKVTQTCLCQWWSDKNHGDFTKLFEWIESLPAGRLINYRNSPITAKESLRIEWNNLRGNSPVVKKRNHKQFPSLDELYKQYPFT